MKEKSWPQQEGSWARLSAMISAAFSWVHASGVFRFGTGFCQPLMNPFWEAAAASRINKNFLQGNLIVQTKLETPFLYDYEQIMVHKEYTPSWCRLKVLHKNSFPNSIFNVSCLQPWGNLLEVRILTSLVCQLIEVYVNCEYTNPFGKKQKIFKEN